MSSTARSSLTAELGVRPPDGLHTLTDESLTHLADRLRDAKQRQSRELEVGIDEALQIVPRLVRGPVRKILFG